jgi:hypothetical protein
MSLHHVWDKPPEECLKRPGIHPLEGNRQNGKSEKNPQTSACYSPYPYKILRFHNNGIPFGLLAVTNHRRRL